ncbi:MAG: hypothetical protein GQE15_37755 [Archangiaceae bacterium]|nr:hypothetical protein [Archangiaceae bacterium]
MAFVSLKSIGNFIKPLATSVIKAVAPAAVDALKGIAGNGISSLFEGATKGLQGLLGNVPLVGPLLSNLVGKYAPGLQNIAQNWVNGGLDKLLSMVTGQPTERPVPGTNTSVTTPPLADPGRTTSIQNNTPSTNTQASTGTPSSPSTGGTSSSGGPSYNGSFPSYPTPPKDPKDLAAQNKFQEDMFNFQQASQNLNMFWQMMQNTLKSMGDTANNAVRNLR